MGFYGEGYLVQFPRIFQFHTVNPLIKVNYLNGCRTFIMDIGNVTKKLVNFKVGLV